MPYYQRIGHVPPKRHTQFRKPDGTLYHEQLFGTEGFSGVSSLLYHLHAPTAVASVGEVRDVGLTLLKNEPLIPRRLLGFQHQLGGDFLQAKATVMGNADVMVSVADPDRPMEDRFYKNAEADEILFVHEGTGVLKTMMGEIPFVSGDYLVVPRGVIYQFHTEGPTRLLILESQQPVRWPHRYQNDQGQLLEHAPFCERDLKTPKNLAPETGEAGYTIWIKKQGKLHELIYQFHPFDVVGWDGCYYPYALSIHDFEPITGRIHQPPPVHQTFATDRCVVCSFVPRLYDYHPDAIPAPYNHSNIDSDEILYYVDGDFMSRSHAEKGMFTLHPGGIPHGPHPGAVENSIGKKATNELAVMIDPFRPMFLTQMGKDLEDPEYYKSWIPKA